MSLHGIEGEPLLFPMLFEILNKIDTNKTYTLFASNGLLLTREMSTKLIYAGLGEINFSIDAASRSTYRKIRNNDGFFIVKNNIKQLVDLKKMHNSGVPNIIIDMVLMKENLSELPDFIDMAKELEVTKVRVRFMVPINENYEVNTETFHFNYYEQRIDSSSKDFKGIIKEAKSKAKNHGIILLCEDPEIVFLLSEENRLELNSYIESYQIKIDLEGDCVGVDSVPVYQNILCIFPWTRVIIGLDGMVRFCCHSTTALGNLCERNFSEIWNGKEARDIRLRILENRFPDGCFACPLRFSQKDAWSHHGTDTK